MSLLLRNVYIGLGKNNNNSKTKNNTLIKFFKSFINYVLKNFYEISTILFSMLFFRYLVIFCFDIDLTSSFFDYMMFVTNIYVVSIWFGDKISVLSSKADKVDLGFKTDYILSRSSPKSLLYLGFISLLNYFIVIPYFIPLVLVPLIDCFFNIMQDVGIIRTVHAMSPEPEAQGAHYFPGPILPPPHPPRDVHSLINSLDTKPSPYFYKTEMGRVNAYYPGQCHDRPLKIFSFDGKNISQEPCQILPANPMPSTEGLYWKCDRNYFPLDPLRSKGKELFIVKSIKENGAKEYISTGIVTPENIPIFIKNHQ